MPQTDVTGIILVGGKSSRMGMDKATLHWHGMRLVDYVAEIMRDAGIQNIYVSGFMDGYKNIPDLLPQNGPVGAIASVISSQEVRSKSNSLLFIPVDMPLLNANMMEKLIQTKSHYDAVHFENRPLPLLLRINPKVERIAQLAINDMKTGMSVSVKRLVSFMKKLELSVCDIDKRLLINTNTPSEWQEATHEPAY